MSMQEEELRRRRGPAGGAGYEGAGGAAIQPGMLAPHMMGLPSNRGGGSGGLEAFLAQMMGGQAPGPSARNFQNSGGWLPPGQEKQQGIGGPNLAPGNIDSGEALNQPGLGLAVGQTGVMPPQSQSWRNYAPGFSAAAQAGFGSPGGIGGPGQRGVPSTGVGEAPGPGGGNRGVGPQGQQQDGMQGPAAQSGAAAGPRKVGGGAGKTQAGGGGGWQAPGIYNDNDPSNNPGWTGPRDQQYANAGRSTASGGVTTKKQGTISHAAIDNSVTAPAGKKKSAGGRVGRVTSGGWQTGGGF